MYIGEFQRRNKNIPRFPTLPSIITNSFFGGGEGNIVFFQILVEILTKQNKTSRNKKFVLPFKILQ